MAGNRNADGVHVWFDSEDIEDICNFYIDLGKIEKAEYALKVGLQLHPTDETMQLLRAHLLIEKAKPEEAVSLLHTLNYKHDYYWHYLMLGALADLRRWDKTAKEAKEALRCDDCIEAYIDIAKVFYNRDQTEMAVTVLLAASVKYPGDRELLDLLMHCYIDIAQYDKALECVEKILDEDPYSVDAWNMKAALHIDVNKPDVALEDLEYSLAINPQNEGTLISKAKLLTMLGRTRESAAVITEIESLTSEWQKLCLMLRGDICFSEKDYKNAYSLYNKGFCRELYMLDSAFHYLECAVQLKRWRKAASVGKFILRYTPNDLKLLEYMADVFFELKQLPETAKMLRRYLRIKPDSVYALLRYGSLMLDINDVKKAYTAIHRAYRLAPDLGQTNLLMAVVCYMKENYKRMYFHYRKACKENPESRDTFFLLCPGTEEYLNRLDTLARQCEENGITDIDKYIFKFKS